MRIVLRGNIRSVEVEVNQSVIDIHPEAHLILISSPVGNPEGHRVTATEIAIANVNVSAPIGIRDVVAMGESVSLGIRNMRIGMLQSVDQSVVDEAETWVREAI